MIHNHWLIITHQDSQPLAQHNTPWLPTWAKWLCIMMFYAEPSGCESWFAMLSQWLWIMVCYAEQGVMYYGVLCWASGCESLCVILSQWLWIMVCYAESGVVNHVELWWASGCESWWQVNNPRGRASRHKTHLHIIWKQIKSLWQPNKTPETWYINIYIFLLLLDKISCLKLFNLFINWHNTPWFTTTSSS
jgi:hypothetical protein